MTEQDAPPETVTITLDGRQVEAKPGEMVIAAAERAGVYIPRFCYHPRMRPVGMCRMCLVQIVGPRGPQLQPACFVPVADGQEVITTSAEVKKAQDGVLEFLLVNHPLDCPVCDKGGECPLQDQTMGWGPGETRFVEEKRHWEKPIALSDLVLIDRERCIQCDRCTRFADEVAGDPLIEFVGRGAKIQINTFPDHPFASYFSGNTVQICPVGALLSKPYRFKARPWDLEQVESTCQTCAVGCRMAVQSSTDELTRYLGIDVDPVNHSWLCDKGRYAYQAVNSDARLAVPQVRKNGDLVEVSWGEALAAAASGIGGARGSDVAVLGGARLPNEDAYAWSKLARTALGTDNVDAQMGDGLPAEVVLGVRRATIDDACRAGAVVLLGPDIKEELPVLYLRLRGAVQAGTTRLIELTPQATGLTPYASVTLTHCPGEAAEVVRAITGARGGGGEAGGVAADTIAAARQVIEDAGGNVVLVLGRPSVAESAAGVVEAAAALLGAYPDTPVLSALRRGNVHGALDMGLAPGVLPGRVSLDAGREWYAEAWGSLPAERGRDCEGILRAAADGQLQALVLVGADPLSDFPDRDLARRALERVPFVVAVDCFETASAGHADVLLPAATFAERGGTTTNIEGRVSRLGPKVTPPGVAWADWMIAAELAARLGVDLGFASLADIWNEVARLSPLHDGVTAEVLGSAALRDGIVLPFTGAVTPQPGATGTDTGAGSTAPVGVGEIDPVATPGISATEAQGDPTSETAPAETESGLVTNNGADATPDVVTKPARLTFAAPAASTDVPARAAYDLRLVAGRKLYDCGVTVQRSPALAPLAAPPVLRVHPGDLERLGVASGGQVRLRGARVTTLVEVQADDGLPRGSAALPFNGPELAAADLITAGQAVTDIAIETP